jgi:hypothetical protein
MFEAFDIMADFALKKETSDAVRELIVQAMLKFKDNCTLQVK